MPLPPRITPPIHETVAREQLELVMRLEADRMTGLVLDDAAVLSERDVMLEERRMRIDNEPSALLREQLYANLFLNNPTRMPTIGWESEIRKLGTADALAFYRDWYVPNNAVLIVAGDADPAEVQPLAETLFRRRCRRDRCRRRVCGSTSRRTTPRSGCEMKSPRVAQPSWRRALRRAELPFRRDQAFLPAASARRDPRRRRRLAALSGAGAEGQHRAVGQRRLFAEALGLTTFGIYASAEPGGRGPRPRGGDRRRAAPADRARRRATTRSGAPKSACRRPRSMRATA